MKKIKSLFAAVLFFSAALLNAEAFFSGNSGIAAKFSNQKATSFDPKLNVDGFFAGQFDLSNSFAVRGEFSIQTGDIYDDLFSETESIFRIDEFSGTYIKPYFGITHFFSVFLGIFEPIGSEAYLERYLGIKPYSSTITENYLGMNGCKVYDFYGFGAAYSLRFNEFPLSTGFLIYKNDRNENETAQLNLDWRIGAAFNGLTLDCTAGIGAPMNTKNAQGDDVVLLIDTLYLHTGIDVLIGNRDGLCLFGQMGFENLPIRSKNEERKILSKDLYLLIEPRLTYESMCMQLSFYNMPKEKVKKTLLLEDTVGADICFTFNTFTKSARNLSAGYHLTVSFEGKDLMDFTEDGFVDAMNLKISPFAKFHLKDGDLNVMLQANVTKFADKKEEAFKLNIGYRKTL
ncbi:MAG: hypothetical protein KBT11_05060 [Treponema sp.]|nr:hypothetical protein [Candidatus Treponema equifaecale]